MLAGTQQPAVNGGAVEEDAADGLGSEDPELQEVLSQAEEMVFAPLLAAGS
jgi:hypothetical protein